MANLKELAHAHLAAHPQAASKTGRSALAAWFDETQVQTCLKMLNAAPSTVRTAPFAVPRPPA